MKIFSIQTKKHLVGWSVIFGFIANFILGFSTQEYGIDVVTSFGLPFKVHDNIGAIDFSESIWYGIKYYFMLFLNPAMILDFLFWILISLIILSVIRYFRKPKSYNLTPKT